MSQLSQPHIENSNEALANDDDDIEIAAELEKALCGNDDQLPKQKANHKSKFEEWLNKKYDAKKTSFVLKKHDIDRIHDVLKGVTRITNAQEKFQLKKKNYSLNADNQVCRTIVNEETLFEHIQSLHPLKLCHLKFFLIKKQILEIRKNLRNVMKMELKKNVILK
jgi:actin-related protein